MKKSITLSLAAALLAAPAFVLKSEDLEELRKKNFERLMATKQCFSCDLANVNFSGIDLSNTTLVNAHLVQANLKGLNLRTATFTGADLRRANLSNTDLTGAVLLNAKLDYADFTNAKLCNTVMPDGQRIFKDC